MPNPEDLRRVAEDIRREREKGNLKGGGDEAGEKRRPRKLNAQETKAEDTKAKAETEKKKPRKIEVRSKE